MPVAAESHGLWGKSAPTAPVTTALSGNLRVDVAVIGAGFTGLSAALHLAESGSKVAVLDTEEIGFGGSGRNVGLVNAGLWVMPSEIPKVLGAEYGERLLSILGDAPQEVYGLVSKHGMDCEAMHVGTLHCAVGDAGLRDIEARYAEWRARGAPVELLDQAAAAR
ncbi:FAD-dependent oxidoreductase, partial [Elstera litoralis]